MITSTMLHNITHDKLLHFAVSALMGSALRWCGVEWWAVLLIVMTIGVAKELYDQISKKGSPEWKDLLADLLGALVGGL